MLGRLSDLTLLALEQSELARTPDLEAGAPLSWPAFVAACEAPPAARQRWTKYWQTLLKHQIGTKKTIWEIVQEVWRRRDSAQEGSENICESRSSYLVYMYSIFMP